MKIKIIWKQEYWYSIPLAHLARQSNQCLTWLQDWGISVCYDKPTHSTNLSNRWYCNFRIKTTIKLSRTLGTTIKPMFNEKTLVQCKQTNENWSTNWDTRRQSYERQFLQRGTKTQGTCFIPDEPPTVVKRTIWLNQQDKT